MPKINIGILDFGYRKNNTAGMNVLADVFEYSSLADESGFSSYWLSEHHNSGQAWSNPEMLLPILAGHTNKINIGLTGILLASHSPYRVALNFKLLENLFPGRIDLGLANAPVELHIAQKLLSDISIDESYVYRFNAKVDELVKYLENEKSLWETEKIKIPPIDGLIPRIWKLTSSFNGLEQCVQKKMHLSKSMFHAKTNEPFNKTTITEFRKNYFQVHGCYPQINIAIAGICEKDNKSAMRTSNELGLKKWSAFEDFIIGSPSYFKEKILKMYEESSIDQFIFYDQGMNPKKRMKTLELISKEFGL
jgi:luciferase family oxidoreductase group 1